MIAAFAEHDSVPGSSGRAAPGFRAQGRASDPGWGITATLPPGTPLRARVAQETAFWAKKPRNISPTIDLGFESPNTSAVTGP